jgi:hypothetical protein
MIRAIAAGLGLAVAALALACLFLDSPAHARNARTTAMHPMCNVLWPCTVPSGGKVKSERAGLYPSKQDRARIARAERFRNVDFGSPMYPPETQKSFLRHGTAILPHPAGCPARAFCGCGAAVEVFGRPVRSLWLAANWLRYPRTAPAPGMVAARRGHVFVIRQVLGGGRVLAFDANSGGRKTRLHVRSLAGFTVVDPSGAVI